jgi:uncharacterized protein (DUF3084 family)
MCGKVTKMRVEYWGEAVNGRNITIALYANNATSGKFVDAAKAITTTSVDPRANQLIQEYQYLSSGSNLTLFQAFYLTLTWGTGSGATEAPKVKKIIVEYENIPINKY